MQTITKETFDTLSPVAQELAIAQGMYVPVSVESAPVKATLLEGQPNPADYEEKEDYLTDIVEFLTSDDIEPILFIPTVTLGKTNMSFNAIRINTKFNLVNEYQDRLYFRTAEIKYCLAVLRRGTDAVNDAQTIDIQTQVGYGGSASSNLNLDF